MVMATPVLPTGDRVRLAPLGLADVRLAPGFWQDRLGTNRRRSLAAIHAQLERAGTLQNFRLAAGGAGGTVAGASFFDSDVHKWLEAAAWELGRQAQDEETAVLLSDLVEETVQLVLRAQAPDGYLNTWFQVMQPERRFTDLESGHELYVASHLIQAGIALHRARSDDRILAAAVRFADLLLEVFGAGRRDWAPEHPGIEMALVELARATGDDRYVGLADQFLTARGRRLVGEAHFGATYRQDEMPFRAAHRARGHAVMLAYLASGAVDVFTETGDRALLDAASSQWADMVGSRTYITGGGGSRYRDESFGDALELGPDQSYAETCAAIGAVMWSWRLLLATGESSYADLIERLMFNAVLVGVDLGGEDFFYANPLQVRADHLEPEDGIGASVRQPWFYVACCPPNLARLLSTFETLLATTSEDGLQVHQYAAAQLDAELPAGHVRVDVSTQYPWSGRIEVRVVHGPAEEWELSLRIPGWSSAATVQVNDGPVTAAAGGMSRHRRAWSPGDLVTLVLDVAPRFTYPHPGIDAARGCVAVERGPLVYCLEGTDLPDPSAVDRIAVDAGTPPQEGEPVAGLPFPSVTVRGGAWTTGGTSSWPYSATPWPRDAVTWSELPLVPYFAWANRSGAPNTMRVWLPTGASAGSTGPAPTA